MIRQTRRTARHHFDRGPASRRSGRLAAGRSAGIHVAGPHGLLQCFDPTEMSIDRLFTNHRNPIFTILRDDVGKHDLIVPCCDQERFARDFNAPDHPHCLRNLKQARDLLKVEFDIHGEQAWNVFMHNRVTPEGEVVTDPAAHGPGSTITLRAEMDVVALLSACPQDLTPCNAFNPTPMKLVVRAA